MEEIVNAILRELHKLEYKASLTQLFSLIKRGKDRDTRYNCTRTLYPVAVSITTYERKAIERLPEGKGYFYADAAYDIRKVLNIVVNRGSHC